MPGRFNIRRISMAVITVLAIVAIAIPASRMIGCDVQMNGSKSPLGLPVISGVCDGVWLSSAGGSAGILPTGAESLMLTLVVALIAVVIAAMPSFALRPVGVRAANPPPPPEDPRGQRLII